MVINCQFIKAAGLGIIKFSHSYDGMDADGSCNRKSSHLISGKEV